MLYIYLPKHVGITTPIHSQQFAKTPVSIVFAEDQKLMRRSLVSLLNDDPSLEVIGEAANGRELMELLKHMRPDIVLLDVEMPVMNGLEALQRISARYPEVRVIMLSMHAEGAFMSELMAKGARACLSKGCDIDTVIKAIHTVKEEGHYFDKAIARVMLHHLRRNKASSPLFEEQALSERETEVLTQLCDGKSNRDIADSLHISPNTVDYHRGNIYTKTKSKNIASLVKYAIRHGIVPLE